MFTKSVVVIVMYLLHSVMCDDYVEEVLQKCNQSKSTYDCDKYKFLKYLEEFDFEWTSNSFVSLIQIPPQEDFAVYLPKYRSDDAEYVKFFKFLRRKVISFLDTHSLAFQLPKKLSIAQGRSSSESSEIAEDKSGEWTVTSRKKRHRMYLIPILIIAKMLKVMILLGLVFSSLIAVKKVLLAGALIFPIILRNIKTACSKKEEHYYPVQTVEGQGWWRSEPASSGIVQFLLNLVTTFIQSSSSYSANVSAQKL